MTLLGCSSGTIQYEKLEIVDVYTEQYSSNDGNGEVVKFHHSLILKQFDFENRSSNDLILFADRYLDTVSGPKPISSITIVRPFHFVRNYDSRDWGEIRDHAIISINYSSDSSKTRLPEITSFTLWEDGKGLNISPLSVSERAKNLGSDK